MPFGVHVRACCVSGVVQKVYTVRVFAGRKAIILAEVLPSFPWEKKGPSPGGLLARTPVDQ